MNEETGKKLPFEVSDIFSIDSDEQFESMALKVFLFQYANNKVYRSYCESLKRDPKSINEISEIPFLPISAFKTKSVRCFEEDPAIVFNSSGTTGKTRSSHFIADLSLYDRSFNLAFKQFYGEVQDYVILGLLPSYLEREGSSLIYMVDHLIKASNNSASGFYLDELDKLINVIQAQNSDQKILLIGVSYALLDLAEKKPQGFENVIVMETGGMKGKRAEMTKEELHRNLKEGLGISSVHSEYGMTELLSQAYSKSEAIYHCPNWMQVFIREHNDPFSFTETKAGGINIIDLANVYSCSFIATDDLGRKNNRGFQILGRLDNSDLRGCNLLLE